MRKILSFGAVLFLVIAAVYWFTLKEQSSYPTELYTLWLGDAELKIELADSSKERGLGLAGRKSLPADRGMLFVFEEPDAYPFWMKDMEFPLDIIWLDENYQMVDIFSDAQPDSYPNTFTPQSPALYVLETNAGWAEKNNIRIGTRAVFLRQVTENTEKDNPSGLPEHADKIEIPVMFR